MISHAAKFIVLLILSVSAIGLSGCATQVHDDYGQYLRNNEGKSTYVPVTDSVRYYLDQKTQNHSQEIRSWTVGIANSWTVRFGDILDATMQGNDLRRVFGQVTKVRTITGVTNLLLSFRLLSYEFADFQAKVSLQTRAFYNANKILDRTYQANGISQGGKMFWGGPIAMKNAVQQSTKDAVDKIFANLITDLQVALKNPPPAKRTAVIPWNGSWFGQNGPYQLYLLIENGSASGRIRTGDQVLDIVGSVNDDGQLRARFDGDAQVSPLDLTGVMPVLALYSAGTFVGNIRMDRRN